MADPVADSILNTVKKVLGIEPDYPGFDLDIMLHINSVCFTLQQLGIGPDEGVSITGTSETWALFNTDLPVNLNAIKSYIYVKVRLLFDPPVNSFTIDALKQQATELEWRLNAHREEVKYPWQDPLTSQTTI